MDVLESRGGARRRQPVDRSPLFSLLEDGASDWKKKEGEQGKAQGHVAGCPSPFFFEQKAMTIRKKSL